MSNPVIESYPDDFCEPLLETQNFETAQEKAWYDWFRVHQPNTPIVGYGLSTGQMIRFACPKTFPVPDFWIAGIDWKTEPNYLLAWQAFLLTYDMGGIDLFAAVRQEANLIP